MNKQDLIEARNMILKAMESTCPFAQPNRLRALQVEASRLANEIGRAA